MQRLGSDVKVSVNGTRLKLYPPIRRGSAIDVYLTSSGTYFRKCSSELVPGIFDSLIILI